MVDTPVKSLNEIPHSIKCPVCFETTPISVHVDGVSNYEGANITSSQLNIILMKPDFIVNSYSIDIHTGLIKVNSIDRSKSNRKNKIFTKEELLCSISTFRLRAGYCTHHYLSTELKVYYAHILHDYSCTIDIHQGKLSNIEYDGFTVSDVKDGAFRKIHTTSTLTEIRVGHCGQPATTALKIKALSLPKCVEMLRSDKYFNFL